MQTENYKKRAVDVRRSARANLQDIRQARLARRNALSGGDDLRRHSDDEDNVRNAETGDDAMISIDSHHSPEEAADPPHGDIVADETDMDDLDALATKNAGIADDAVVEKDTPLADEAALEDADVASQVPPQSRIADWKQSDLAKLPGAGPGLIWMLNQCGITKMTELAAADCDSLTGRLGVVGQILDVGQWIGFAQSTVKPQ